MVHFLRKLENGNSRPIFPYSPQKTRSNEPRFELVATTVPEIFLPDEDRCFTWQIRVLSVNNGWTHSYDPIYLKAISYFQTSLCDIKTKPIK